MMPNPAPREREGHPALREREGRSLNWRSGKAFARIPRHRKEERVELCHGDRRDETDTMMHTETP